MLLAKEVTISKEYFDFLDLFFKKSAAKLLEHSDINKQIIDLELDKHLFFNSINSLGSVKFKIFKTYIKTNLANKFIQASKFLVKLLTFLSQSLIKVSGYM